MGIYDRDYARVPTTGDRLGQLRMWSVTTWLIVINVTVFFVDGLLRSAGFAYPLRGLPILVGPLESWGHFSAGTTIVGLQLWRFLTFQFLHANLQHLFFNMLGLYFFGQMMETYLGRNRFLIFYLTCGVAGAACYLLLWLMHVLVGSAWTPMVGASAGIFGILAAASRVAPRATVMLIFPPMPVELRTWALVLLGLAAATIIFAGPNAGGEAAHLGGAILGYFTVNFFRPRSRMRYFS
ncbi:MAG: rhomboid family intramembrane serine protease [Phycisphaerae bacterium]|nr:rhomboid family intramembrane serine protease [Phycisphaerae bacterium]MDW8261459.1 rhomboid family intramembrane serine protease [Phycisphaerales bacterium]